MTPDTALFRRDLLGTVGQLARVDQFAVTGGPAHGTRVLRLVNGGGLEVELHADRALDLGRVTYRGRAFAWLSPAGFAAPALADPHEEGWLRTFGGGLLATCGLDSFGDPSTTADGTRYPQHGRIGALPAHLLRAEVTDEQVIVQAEVRQAALHGEHLRLHRTVRSPLGSHSLTLTDVVTNESAVPQPHMVLYHVNLGWPLLGPRTVLVSPATHVEPENDAARASGQPWNALHEPAPDAGSLVYLHRPPDTQEHWTVSATNPDNAMRLDLTASHRSLPFLHTWTSLRPKQYVVGLEPANAPLMSGRAEAEARGLVPLLAPHASVRYDLRFELDA
ncbi:DUF4432 family protein [Streptomyces chartreusis]|uniref:DUF4432 family protein n=1 Tax=Streptomyces chartreusis TaxID=1969 RepID=UPI0037236268